jgi:tetratricopeptide (TPR) repeat protein
MDFLSTLWTSIPGAEDSAKLRFLIVAAGGLGVVWGLVRWLRKEDLGTTTKTILKTQRGAEERAAGDSERLRHLEGLVQNLEATLASRLAALPYVPGKEIGGEAASAIAQDLNAAVQRLASGGEEAALESLAAGDEREAMKVLTDMRAEKNKAREDARKEEAALSRELGAIALLSDTHEAMRHYAEACELDPENAAGWTQLGHLQRGAGDFAPAMVTYERVLGNASADPASMAIATCNLGTLNEMRGDMGAACENWRKALALFRQVGMPVQIEQVEDWMRAAGCPD